MSHKWSVCTQLDDQEKSFGWDVWQTNGSKGTLFVQGQAHLRSQRNNPAVVYIDIETGSGQRHKTLTICVEGQGSPMEAHIPFGFMVPKGGQYCFRKRWCARDLRRARRHHARDLQVER